MTAVGTVAGMTDGLDDLQRAADAEAEAAHKKTERRKAAVSWGWALLLVAALLVICGGVFGNRTPPPGPDLYGDAKRACQDEFIPKRLKAPKTAEFSGVRVEAAGNVYTVTGSVDAQNGFGALIRSPFTCVVRESSDGKRWLLESATVG